MRRSEITFQNLSMISNIPLRASIEHRLVFANDIHDATTK